MKGYYSKMMSSILEDFFKSINKKYSIDIKDDWEQFIQTPKDVYFCIHEFTRNPKKGEVCGKQIKSGEYCSQHKIKDKTKDTTKDKTPNKVSEEKNLIVRLNIKVGKFIHAPTKLAFFSKEHKVVYGKLSSVEDKIIPLSDKDIDTCKKYLFRYDTSLYNSLG